MKPRLFSTAYLVGEGRDRLERRFDITLEPWLDPAPPTILSPEDLAGAVTDLGATVLVVEADMVGADLFARAEGLAVVAATRGDPWNVDVAAATNAGVLALRTPGRNAGAVAELAIGLMLAVARGIATADADIRNGRFVVDERIPQQRFRGPQIRGKTVGLLGFGAVGHEVAWRAAALRMSVIVYDPYAPAGAFDDLPVEQVDGLDALLERSHFLSVHAAKTDETEGMVGAEEVALLPSGAFVINTAREEIVDRAALVAALESGHLAGAALDHFAGEYLAPDDPLCALPNVVLTPHIGGASVDADACHTTMLADAFDALATGETPTGALNPECAAGARTALGEAAR